MDYKQRRESILSNFAKAKTDLENLNAEIQAEMDDNDSSIKTFSKFLK